MTRIGLRAFIAVAALAAVALSVSAQESLQGQWLADYTIHGGRGGPNDLQTNLSLHYREEKPGRDGRKHISNWNETRWVEHSQLHGLTREQAFSPAGTNVRFQIRREAGAFECEGWFKDGRGSGHYTFVPNPQFAAELQRRGVGTPTSRQLLSLALSETGLALLDELKAQGYEQPDVARLVRLGDHGVRVEYVRGLRDHGYRPPTLDALQRMRDHGVTLEYIREMRDGGFKNLTAEELVRARDHGVSVSFIRELEAAGYEAPNTLAGLVRLRDHGVSAKFIRELKSLGYTDLHVEQLVRLRDHGVTASFITRVKSERTSLPTVEELIRLKNRGEYE
jgi:hypothetical protein